MELKYMLANEWDTDALFKLYLYGIEISFEGYSSGMQCSSNCTFMELKYINDMFSGCNALSSNCTFMELKWLCASSVNLKKRVQIVPLWN